MATKQAPTLPTELWIRVLENIREDADRLELWISMRHVSKAFKDAVESIFRDRHLPKTQLDFWFRMYAFLQQDPPADARKASSAPDADQGVVLDNDFEFNRLSEDMTTAVFRAADIEEGHEPELRNQLRLYLENMNFEEPKHTVTIRRELNDTPIPGFVVDYEALEVSCPWRDLYTAYYVEERLSKKLMAKKEQLTEGLKAKFESGEMDMAQVIELAVKSIAEGETESRKTARRARIQRQFKQRDGTNWDFERDGHLEVEAKVTKRLIDLGNAVYLERDFSDDEEVGDDEDEDDEWEDEDEDDEGDDEDEIVGTDDEDTHA